MTENTKTFKSIFSDTKDDQNQKLWVKYCPTTHKSIQSEAILFFKSAGKFKLSSQKIIKNYFCITKDNLLYYTKTKNHLKIKGVFDLKFSRVEYIKLEDGEKTNKYLYILRFIKNFKFTDLYVNSEEDMNNWTEFLNKRITQSNFHKKYTPIKQIGEGGFAKVSYITILNILINY